MPVMTAPAPPAGREEPKRSSTPPHGGCTCGGGGGPRRGIPRGIALLITAVLAAALTYLGMLTQIWANLAGSQLPGA